MKTDLTYLMSMLETELFREEKPMTLMTLVISNPTRVVILFHVNGKTRYGSFQSTNTPIDGPEFALHYTIITKKSLT